MKLLELFSGTASMANVFREFGHKAFTVDIDFGFNPDLCIDIRSFHKGLLPIGFCPDVIWASPPCQRFSVASIGKNWDKDGNPKNRDTLEAIFLVRKVLGIVSEIKPRFWFIENPVGMLRKVSLMKYCGRHTVTYCQYGDSRMKPTDIWSNCFNLWKAKPPCKAGDTCHESAPRGSKTGTQGLANAIERGKIPRELCIEIMQVCERNFSIGEQEETAK